MMWSHRPARAAASVVALAALVGIGAGIADAEVTHFEADVPWPAPDGTPPTGDPGRAEAEDPIGDTFGAGAVQLDATSLSLSFTPDSLLVGMTFATPIEPYDQFDANSLSGGIDLDLDQNPATGLVPLADTFCPSTPTGVGSEAFVDLGSVDSSGGTVVVLTSGGSGPVPITFSPTSFEATIPLALLDGDDGLVHGTSVIGTFFEPTDCVPDGAFLASTPASGPVPEPEDIPTLGGSGRVLAILALGLIAARTLARRRTTRSGTPGAASSQS